MKASKKPQNRKLKNSGVLPKEAPIEAIHQLRGRVRFRVSGLRGIRALGSHLEKELILLQGIRRVSASAATGNLLVHYEEPLAPAALAGMISRVLEGSGTGPAQRVPRYDESPFSWHMAEPEQVLKHFQVSTTTGLSEDSALWRLTTSGTNALPAMLPRSFPELLAAQVKTLPVLLIVGAAGLSVVTGGIAEGLIAMGVALLNALIGASTEKRAAQTLEIARDSVGLRTTVVRQGKVMDIPFDEVVAGDVLDLQIGSRLPADARLVETEHLAIDESALTGESIPVTKFVRAHRREGLPISQRRNMLYRGTLVVEGRGRAVVVATGKHTALGKLQQFLGVVFPPEALMARGIKRLAVRLLWVAAGGAALLSTLSLLRGHGLLQILRQSIALIAGAIPSGLSTLSASAFAIGHRDMQHHRIRVRRLRALASLASTQVVCFDKTGTLTHNQMTVTEIHGGAKHIEIPGNAWTSTLKRNLAKDPDISWLLKLTTLCNEAVVSSHSGGPSGEGSSTEKALLLFAERAGMDTASFRADHPFFHVQHRSEKHPFMVTVHPWERSEPLSAVKGSPLDVLEMCAYWRKNGKVVPLLEKDRNRFETENFHMSGKGLRVLAVAYRWGRLDTPQETEDHPRGLVWAGLVGFSDPLRKGAKELISTLHEAGIRTAVITGDQSLTAAHIGEELNLAGEEQVRVLDALNFRELDTAAMRNLVTRTHVFARLNPTQKLEVIQAYQSAGIGVVMVGDGINDVLALKVADVGIAMGGDGTDLARNAADLVLEDDDLRNVAVAIANGREFYGNIDKSLRFLITASHVDLMSDFTATAGALGQGISPWQSVGTNLACLSLASERHETVKPHSWPPERSGLMVGSDEFGDTAAEAAKLIAAAGPAGLYGLARYGAGSAASSLFFRSISINQLLYALACRDGDEDPAASRATGPLLRLTLWGAVGGSLALTLFRGFGGVVDALALGAGALLSRELTKGRR
jgi:Ca2+-transporting ATPase